MVCSLLHCPQWYKLWENLKQGYDFSERTRRPPNVEVRYVFDNS